uniref:Uncharacterized protein n=1 Tax=Solanum lycopersicum TaxID=4081 RepID=A0A3Q7F475_SOLLC
MKAPIDIIKISSRDFEKPNYVQIPLLDLNDHLMPNAAMLCQDILFFSRKVKKNLLSSLLHSLLFCFNIHFLTLFSGL